MVAMQDVNQQDGVPLEVRMRNLILKNSDKAQAEGATANIPRSSSSTFVHPTGAGEPNASAPSQDDPSQSQTAQKGQAGRKRMNQAQRRQMSSQLSVSIDPRATESQPNQPFGNSSGNNYRHNHQHRNQRSQSGAWRPPHMNDGPARHHPSPSYPGVPSPPNLFDWRQQGGVQNGYSGNQPGFSRPNHAARNSGNQTGPLYNPRPYQARAEDLGAQVALLEQLCAEIRANAEINYEQIKEKEDFRLLIEDACRVAITQYEVNVNGRTDFPPFSVQLRCFGSLSSGFATKSSDMDLGLLSPLSHPRSDSQDSPMPRLIEKTFLEMGLGARLLSKTRIPIIKVCQKPPKNLYLDLLDERTKWEKGTDEDQELEEEDAKDERQLKTPDMKHRASSVDFDAPGVTGGQSFEKSDTICGDENGSDGYQAALNDLRQGSKSLPNYYASAKKVLRKLGGKDITNSTAASFTDDDFRILNDVCKAFVHGLADDHLRTRLLRYTSLSFDENAPIPRNRTIFGVMTQIEGEKLVIAFETREIREKDDHLEQIAINRVAHWVELQNRSNCGFDPLSFNKELLSAVELLKKTPSIGLLLLEQGQYESAASYHSRAIRLMIELGGHDLPSSQSPILPVVQRQYAHGIYEHEIRTQVIQSLNAMQSPTLRGIARRHKSLHLAREFERALEKGLYSAEYADDIRAYIELLRGPMTSNTSGNVHFDSMLHMTPEGWSLVARMREIPDPARMSPNQPRDPYKDKLEFPKSGVGVQCDINFSAQLALQNTHLLRCYSLTDDRVRPLVLFVKHWAKVRGINTPYRGTLSSYGYVLMVLHYLVNVARPFVCPNLQLLAPPVDPDLTPEQIENTVNCQGRDIRFWRDQNQIASMAQQGMLNQNKESVGYLLRGFFEYYAQGGMMSTGHGRGFDWGRDVISLRTQGGILGKQAKGWTGAKTVLEVQSSDKPPVTEPEMPQANPLSVNEEQSNGTLPTSSQTPSFPDATTVSKSHQDRAKPEVKEVRYRFLFAIEDPFELEHNVARTVTHNGIVSIRDEFRRAWRLIKNAGRSQSQETLLQDISVDRNAQNTSFRELLDEIHGYPPSPLYNGTVEVVSIRQTPVRQQDNNVDVISLTSDSDDNSPGPSQQQQQSDSSDNGDGGGNNSANDQIWGYDGTEVQAYYGLQGLPRRQALIRLQYQTDYAPQAEYPSPMAGLRFNVAQLRKDLNWPKRVTQSIIDTAFNAQNFQDSAPLLTEDALTTHWLAGTPELVKGFPLVEDVVFLVQPNMAGEPCDCFFKAVAFHVYGNHTFHPRVKAEHLQHFREVLQWTTHPRHQVYTSMNSRFYSTTVGSKTTVANFYQMLTIPKIYTALDVFDVTADLYNLFIVVYTLDNDRVVTGVTAMGSYNARHVFICHVDGNHFQPMVPNDYYASEFQLPRITYKSTLGQPMTGSKVRNKHALEHPWRNRTGKLDRKQGALPVEHVFYSTALASVMRGTQLS
ncbi:hypothetical protein VMCG_02303 [Cytospora schulzeri]|uniref:polynucleotide adenylyltransferase n=1 Tax=Cytospora schulzeri TaxID=448051 RepID=A0A423X167_9PEZI|nr:hypothetical protein VMCG_02303 [Valsa malicola]